jgi:ferric-dicitrate binding protein FerR (iron transport regulator)
MSKETTPEELIKRYLEGNCTPEEQALVESWHLEEFKNSSETPSLRDISATHEQMRNTIIAHAQHKTRILWPRIAAAASVLIALSAGGYLLLHKPAVPVQVAVVKPEELAPMNKGVILTMGSGKTLVLNNTHKGIIQTADGAKASQSDEALTYEQTASAEPVTHTLTNNTGNKYSLTLADGTEVFLDAASSITYPVAFTGKDRKVSVTGQVYLKVKHNAAMPFRVAVADEIIEDIGTEFNINAYADEPALKTTLIEGAVKVSRKQHAILLQPGEETIVANGSMDKKTADLEKTLAWLQGKQIFNKEPLERIMNRIARIYDVQLVWIDPETKNMKFGGSFDRTKKLSTVLNFLRKVGPDVDFTVEGKTVKIFKKKHH